MADPFTVLIVLSGAMFMGSYFAGAVPLMFTMSESRMRVVSIFGAGLLLGTALSVIIPEGVESLYSAQLDSRGGHGHSHVSESGDVIRREVAIPQATSKEQQHGIIPQDPQLNQGLLNVDTRLKREAHEEQHSHTHGEETEHGKTHSHSSVHSQIGYSLVIGFVFMLLVDQISTFAIGRNERSTRQRLGISATIGLVVHAAADGIALGSASSINKADVQFIVFIAIMLHKGPAAFGLVSFLLVEALDKRAIRKHLLVFSCAAPVAAVITYIVISNLGSDSMAASESSTGVLMLFSAGTFLYVATVHVLPELASQGKGSSSHYDLVVDAQSPSTLGGHSHSAISFTISELFYIIVGAIVPAILSSGHSH